MSQLFGFPSGLSGGSKETSHGTAHSTLKSTAYDSHFNTNYDSDFNTDATTQHTSTWSTQGGYLSSGVDHTGLPRFWGISDINSGYLGAHQGMKVTTMYHNSNGGYIEIQFADMKGPRYKVSSPYQFSPQYTPNFDENYKAKFYFGPGAPTTNQYTQHYVASINDVSVNDVVDGCTTIVDTYGNQLEYGGDAYSNALDNFCVWILDIAAIAQDYPTSYQYASPSSGRWYNLGLDKNSWRYPPYNTQMELLPESQSGSYWNASWTYHNADADVHFKLMRRQLHFAKFVLDKYKDRPEIKEHYQKFDFSPMNGSYADNRGNQVTLGEYDSIWAWSGNSNAAGWFPLGWWIKNLDECYNTGGYSPDHAAIGLSGSNYNTPFYARYGHTVPRIQLRWNHGGSQYGAWNSWMAPTRGGRVVSYTGGAYIYNSYFQTSYSSSRTTDKITTKNTDKSTFRNTTKNTAEDTNYTTEYITYG